MTDQLTAPKSKSAAEAPPAAALLERAQLGIRQAAQQPDALQSRWLRLAHTPTSTQSAG